MIDLIGKYNRNRKIIWMIIGIAVAVYAIIHILNSYLSQTLYNEEATLMKINDNFYNTNHSVISSQEIDKNLSKENSNIIKKFIDYCNEKNVDKAYNLLSNECKEIMFPTTESFKKGYVEKIFNESKTYNVQSWIVTKNRYVYRIELIEDMLATGKTSNIKTIEYYTIVNNDGEYLLNISNLIERELINKTKETDKIKINIKSADIYVNHLYINIEVENKTQNSILLDRGTKGDSVYIKDTKAFGYASHLFEETSDNLTIRKKSKKEFRILFDKEFNNDVKIGEIGFLDIIVNYENEEEREKIVIEIEDKK